MIHNISTINVNKFPPSSKDDKRIQTLDCIKVIAYGISKEILDNNEKINQQKTFEEYT